VYDVFEFTTSFVRRAVAVPVAVLDCSLKCAPCRAAPWNWYPRATQRRRRERGARVPRTAGVAVEFVDGNAAVRKAPRGRLRLYNFAGLGGVLSGFTHRTFGSVRSAFSPIESPVSECHPDGARIFGCTSINP
jgi:hypothetical protein